MHQQILTLLRISFITVMATFIFSLGAVGGYLGRDYIINNRPNNDQAKNFALYWEAWNHVKQQFYGDIPSDKIATYGAIKGTMATLNDPYTMFIEPEPAAQEKAHLEGQFGGIGAYLRKDDASGQVLLDPMPGQPADQAGIKKDDVLLAVDQKALTKTTSLDEVVNLVRGQIGTKVVLTIERDGKSLEVTVTRAAIEKPSVQWRILEEAPSIGYIQLNSFTERSNRELNKAFDDLAEKGAKSYIFDLRGNGGGLLESAVDVGSQFLEKGIILREDRKNEGEKTYDVRNGGKALTEPLVLLIDGGTASASEIVGGALQDYKRATLIGQKSFGKGSVQLIYDLADKSRIHVTVAKWFTPNGNKIDGIGLKPDIEVPITEDDRKNNRDPQLARAISFLQDGK